MGGRRSATCCFVWNLVAGFWWLSWFALRPAWTRAKEIRQLTVSILRALLAAVGRAVFEVVGPSALGYGERGLHLFVFAFAYVRL